MKPDSGDDPFQMEYSKEDNSEQHVNSLGGELKQPEASGLEKSDVSTTSHDEPHSEEYMTTQVASEGVEIMEGTDSMAEQCCAALEVNSELNVVDCLNEGGDAVVAGPNPTFVNGYEIIDLTDTDDDMDDTDDARTALAPIPELVDLPDMDQIDDVPMTLAIMPEIIDLTDMYQIADVPMSVAPRKNITLVLDLDGTLIHSEAVDDGVDFSFLMRYEEQKYTVYVKKRPHLDAFLEQVAQMFELVAFTGSTSSYANQLLDVLDPENKLISRCFCRESCIKVDGSLRKDLTIIEADLAKVAIIDNTPEVFQLQVNNGIPIKSWSSDPSDISLLELIPFSETLAIADDVRPIIANKFAN